MKTRTLLLGVLLVLGMGLQTVALAFDFFEDEDELLKTTKFKRSPSTAYSGDVDLINKEDLKVNVFKADDEMVKKLMSVANFPEGTVINYGQFEITFQPITSLKASQKDRGLADASNFNNRIYHGSGGAMDEFLKGEWSSLTPEERLKKISPLATQLDEAVRWEMGRANELIAGTPEASRASVQLEIDGIAKDIPSSSEVAKLQKQAAGSMFTSEAKRLQALEKLEELVLNYNETALELRAQNNSIQEASRPLAQADEVKVTTVDGDEVKTTSVDGDGVKATAVDGNEVTTTTVDGNEVKTTSVDGDGVKATAVDGNEVTTTTVEGDEVKTTTVDGDGVKTTAVDGNEVTTTTVEGDEVKTTTVDGDEVKTTAVDGDEVKTTTVEGDRVTTTTVDGNEVKTTVVDGGEIKSVTQSIPEVDADSFKAGVESVQSDGKTPVVAQDGARPALVDDGFKPQAVNPFDNTVTVIDEAAPTRSALNAIGLRSSAQRAQAKKDDFIKRLQAVQAEIINPQGHFQTQINQAQLEIARNPVTRDFRITTIKNDLTGLGTKLGELKVGEVSIRNPEFLKNASSLPVKDLKALTVSSEAFVKNYPRIIGKWSPWLQDLSVEFERANRKTNIFTRNKGKTTVVVGAAALGVGSTATCYTTWTKGEPSAIAKGVGSVLDRGYLALSEGVASDFTGEIMSVCEGEFLDGLAVFSKGENMEEVASSFTGAR